MGNKISVEPAASRLQGMEKKKIGTDRGCVFVSTKPHGITSQKTIIFPSVSVFLLVYD
jgi:hypothetical protein